MDPDTLIQWVELQLGSKQVTMEARFYEDLAAVSVDMLHLVVTVEEHTGIFIPEEKIADLRTVRDLYDFILKEQGKDHG